LVAKIALFKVLILSKDQVYVYPKR